nr:isoform 2 of abc transporter c family member 8 [Quercus suber]
MASVTWEVLIVAILAMVAAKYFQGYYKPSMRELIRINGTTKAPVMNYAAETSLEVNLTLFTAAFLLVLLPNGFIAPGLVGLSFLCSITNRNPNFFDSMDRVASFEDKILSKFSIKHASGKILVDGLDICFIGLKDLRMKLSIIPQEPTLFKGSMWTNLDPLGLNSDDDIWKALEKCQLKATISSLPNLLDSSVSDEGENWSAGQRQLFCLGRVLLKRNKILVLDEATASIDSATDAVLQRIIRQEFSECTVITVAHEFLLLLIVIWSWSSLMGNL